MNRTERFYRIDQLLRERCVVSLESFLAELEVSSATFKRDIEYLRDRLHAPIEWDRAAGGYRFSNDASSGPIYELPGLWFSATELYALLAAQKLLADLEPSFLLAHIAPLQARLSELLTVSGHSTDEIAARVRFIVQRQTQDGYAVFWGGCASCVGSPAIATHGMESRT